MENSLKMKEKSSEKLVNNYSNWRKDKLWWDVGIDADILCL